ncbi:bifunctional [glutamine synthetase] adenylyltransferase/[glutamine synthetase]-adenylyl-L-tyrosine phosphorylase [Paroceanicella profunda]|uniref:Bifunctional [glutamine synthetase] adenylyltransferase/[glutamine synthetase]-adenylyl-L-tyrosine phosphorylase n=1 Tax=Paroceanicella profunda TaxID=2579971 RepID=A0A5B8FTX7_9RHOB|nr:bifunctional [glutamine synthetase] adenylyltransferase/[glutamine synthetase]-adenylyl-L-tyrosine phosphorylase [Paroceanicella profunda]QDL92246.1 bifunctional [glutamine synthetase] adenylyltransferase/[glutamine synthetase]-adenylyl-L-tyrosine phosphorylase [Paroceanicella profunda]
MQPLAARITRFPLAADPERAADILAGLPGGLPEPLTRLAGATAGSSNFLAGLIAAQPEVLADLAARAPEAILADILATPPGPDPDRMLREAKRRLALVTALADLGGVWSLSEVTGAITDFADYAVQTALRHHLAAAIERGRLPESARQDHGGMFVLAMGKMGARELNYSSDIDLICLFDERRYPPDAYAGIRAGFVRVTQGMVRTLSAQTAHGYVLRTDLRLRPDPSVTPVCIGMGVAETYYESLGRTWERAAMIKARPCAGDLVSGQAFLDNITPFIWRRHLDFAAIEDAHDMQRRIRDHKGLHGPCVVPGHDVKLGRGGIRTIEFFAQTRQLICGGRDPELRCEQTVPALHALARRGWIQSEVAEALSEAYVAHRSLEHRIQMLEDAQTHVIPRSDPARARLAALCGEADLARFDASVKRRFEQVDRLTEAFFSPNGAGPAPAVDEEGLQALGYARPAMVTGLLDRWHAGLIPATRADRARAILKRIEPEIVSRLARAANPDEAFARFDSFLSGLPAGVQLLSLLEANPQLLDLLGEVFAASPRLAGEMARHPGVLDPVLEGGFFGPVKPLDSLLEALGGMLSRAGDYEQVLDAARRWDREMRFRIGVQLLRGIATAEEAGAAFTRVAEASLRALLPHVEAAFAERFGPPPGRGHAILGMGKLGSGEMTISSDLDLIVIYDPAGETESAGPRPLAVTAYYARLTQALVSALSSPTAEGTLYAVDMRLRPSGRQGPVAVSLSAFGQYQCHEAWSWEHMALTRARIVSGPGPVGEDVSAVIGRVRTARRDAEGLLADARDMRSRLGRAHSGQAARIWEVKHRPGGMMDIELLVQTGLLATRLSDVRAPRQAIAPLVAAGFIAADAGEVLSEALHLQTIVQHYARLSVEGTFTPEAAGTGLVEALIRATGDPDLARLATRLERLTDSAAQIVARRLGG